MSKTHNKMIAEQATGVREHKHGLGTFYTAPWNDNGYVTGGGEEIESNNEAYDLLVGGRGVAVPNAGAGSYPEFFTSVGFTDARSIEDNSSAGDWTLAVQHDESGDWYMAFQTNRYPHHGFVYTVDFDRGGFSTFEAICAREIRER